MIFHCLPDTNLLPNLNEVKTILRATGEFGVKTPEAILVSNVDESSEEDNTSEENNDKEQ